MRAKKERVGERNKRDREAGRDGVREARRGKADRQEETRERERQTCRGDKLAEM